MPIDLESSANKLIDHRRLHTRFEVLSRPSPVPQSPGVYAWFFEEVPGTMPTHHCRTRDGLTLLYVGISPKADPKVGRPSRQTLRIRVRYHFSGNAEGSTLRLSLGCLLGDRLGIQLRRVGSGNRMTFTVAGEETLSDWMAENARVGWIEYEEPWKLENYLISKFSLPLNLADNDHHPYRATLSGIRRDCRMAARGLPIVAK